MSNPADNKATDIKSDAAPAKATADAVQAPQPAVVTKAPEVQAPQAAAPKIDRAVADVKSAPAKAAAKPTRKFVAKKAAANKTAGKKTLAPRRAAKTQPVAATPVAAPKRATPTISQLKDKIMATTQTTDFTQNLKDTAAQAQTRAKAAYDRVQNYAGDMTEFTKGNVEALVESGKILGQGMQDIARSEIEAAKGAFETVTADLRAMAAVKSPTELFKLQGEIARRNFDAAVARASKNAEVSVKLANDAFAPISSRMSVAAERMSNAA